MLLHLLSSILLFAAVRGAPASGEVLAPNPFDTLTYTEAALVVVDSARCSRAEARRRYGKGLRIEPGRTLDTCLMKRTVLGRSSVRRIMSILNDTNTYRHEPVSCYNPQVGIVFLDASKVVVGYVLICMECDKIRSWPEIPANYHRRVVDSETGEELFRLDMGRSGKKKVWRFLKEHGITVPLELRSE